MSPGGANPHQGDDRERAVGLDVQGVAAVAVRRAEALLGGEHVGAGQVPARLLGNELRGVRPTGTRGDGGADAVDKFAQPGGGADLGRRHALSVRPINSCVQC